MVENLTTVIKSKTKKVKINREFSTAIIGERINPTGRKKMQEELRRRDTYDRTRKLAPLKCPKKAIRIEIHDCILPKHSYSSHFNAHVLVFLKGGFIHIAIKS